VAALCGCTEDSFEAAVTAAALIGTVGEIASETAKGTGSLYVGMLDTLTNITPDIFTQYAKIENYTGE
jgi:hydroxyethylthiazole kinase